jgi:phage shock protein PspC (stress-responsive transcriptional regulator)
MTDGRRLTRSADDKMVAGVCAGIAEYFGWSPLRVRIVYVVGSIISAAFPGLFIYLALWFLLPEEYEVEAE